MDLTRKIVKTRTIFYTLYLYPDLRTMKLAGTFHQQQAYIYQESDKDVDKIIKKLRVKLLKSITIKSIFCYNVVYYRLYIVAPHIITVL